jgi:hypothetical protein
MKDCTDDPMVLIRRSHGEIDHPSDVGSFRDFSFPSQPNKEVDR